jgi:hypothetical protein
MEKQGGWWEWEEKNSNTNKSLLSGSIRRCPDIFYGHHFIILSIEKAISINEIYTQI